jgi:hypothetical protein
MTDDRQHQIDEAVKLVSMFSEWMGIDTQARMAAADGDLQVLVDQLVEIAEIYQDEAERIACL